MLEGADYAGAFAHARSIAERAARATFVPAFDDPLIIAGQGTVALEVLAAAPELDTIVVPVGGGGLIAGIAVAVKHLRARRRVIGVQTEGYPGHAARAGRGPAAGGGPTIAEGIAVTEPGALTASDRR